MCADKSPEPRDAWSRIEAVLTWLGGGHSAELGERHERSAYAIGGVVVLLGAVLAWIVAALAVAGSTAWPAPAVVASTAVFGVLIGAVTRATASGPTRGASAIAGRGAVAVAVGIIVGELAALVVFSGSIDRVLDEQAARAAASAPAVTAASADLDRIRDSRTVLDHAVEQARTHRDQALVVARCESNPTPACPATRITGVPGVGPETRTANELLADAQRELDNALAARDRRAPELDAEIADAAQALTRAREIAVADTEGGLAARWVAMNDYTSTSPGALALRLLTLMFCVLLSVLPLIIALWRGETTRDRGAAARAERDRAELQADTAIAVKRAEVRAAAEILWADQQLARARLAAEAQIEIDRAVYRRRVAEAIDGTSQAVSQRVEEDPGPVAEDRHPRIAAEAVPARLPAVQHARGDGLDNLPVEASLTPQPADERGNSLIPTIPDVTRAAARWARPLVPAFVARAIDTSTQPLRVARQVIEEVEEITFLLRRTHKVTVTSEESPEQPEQQGSAAIDTKRRAESSIGRSDSSDDGSDAQLTHRRSLTPADDLPLGLTERDGPPALQGPDGPPALQGPDGPRRLPPAQ